MAKFTFGYLGGGGSSGGKATPLTYLQAQDLVTEGKLKPGGIYVITNATHANGGRGSVTLIASSPNSFFQEGSWTFQTQNRAVGAINFNWTSGNSRKIEVDGQDISALITWATSQTASMTALVASINSLSGTTGYRAYLAGVNSNSSADRGGTIAIERVAAGQINDAGKLDIVLRDASNVISANVYMSPIFGGTPVETVTFNCLYDFTTNQIIFAEDSQFNVKYGVGLSRITELGYNPIYTFYWRNLYRTAPDVTLNIPIARNCNFDGLGFNNYGLHSAATPSAGGNTQAIFWNCNFKNGRLENKWANAANYSGEFVQFQSSTVRPSTNYSSANIIATNCNFIDVNFSKGYAISWQMRNSIKTAFKFAVSNTHNATEVDCYINSWDSQGSVVNTFAINQTGGTLQAINFANGQINNQVYNWASSTGGVGTHLCPNIVWNNKEVLIKASYGSTAPTTGTYTLIPNIPSGAYLTEIQYSVAPGATGGNLLIDMNGGTNQVIVPDTAVATLAGVMNGTSLPTPVKMTSAANIRYIVSGSSISGLSFTLFLKINLV